MITYLNILKTVKPFTILTYIVLLINLGCEEKTKEILLNEGDLQIQAEVLEEKYEIIDGDTAYTVHGSMSIRDMTDNTFLFYGEFSSGIAKNISLEFKGKKLQAAFIEERYDSVFNSLNEPTQNQIAELLKSIKPVKSQNTTTIIDGLIAEIGIPHGEFISSMLQNDSINGRFAFKHGYPIGKWTDNRDKVEPKRIYFDNHSIEKVENLYSNYMLKYETIFDKESETQKRSQFDRNGRKLNEVIFTMAKEPNSSYKFRKPLKMTNYEYPKDSTIILDEFDLEKNTRSRYHYQNDNLIAKEVVKEFNFEKELRVPKNKIWTPLYYTVHDASNRCRYTLCNLFIYTAKNRFGSYIKGKEREFTYSDDFKSIKHSIRTQVPIPSDQKFLLASIEWSCCESSGREGKLNYTVHFLEEDM